MDAARIEDEFFTAVAGARRPLLLLDYDGTLARFRVDRFQARPWAGVRELLALIQSQKRTRTAVVTGRPACEIAPMLGLDPPFEVWGLHGAERLFPDGRRELELAPPATQARLDELKAHLRRDALGGLFEDKANGAVMHWRGRTRRQKAEIERRTRALFEPLAALDGLRLLEFESGIELRAGRNKGGAVEAILAEEAAAGNVAPPVAFLGDDLSDEAAFLTVNGAAGAHLSVLVRPKMRGTAAEIWLRFPAELRAFLGRWAGACQAAIDSSAGLPAGCGVGLLTHAPGPQVGANAPETLTIPNPVRDAG
ncbi:MAG: trehalose-phosphatase [Terracidiphilus sp.]